MVFGPFSRSEEVTDPVEAKVVEDILAEDATGKEYTTDEAKIYALGALVDRLREQNRTLQILCERQVGEWQRLRAVAAIWKRRAVKEAEQRGIPPALVDEVWPDPTDAQIEAEIVRQQG